MLRRPYQGMCAVAGPMYVCMGQRRINLYIHRGCHTTHDSSIHHSPPISVCLHHNLSSTTMLHNAYTYVHYDMCISLQVRSSVVAKFEPKYQNSSLRAMADSSSLLTRLRVGGGRGRGSGSVARAPPTGRERRQQRLLNETRVEARNRMILEQASGLDCKCTQ